MLRMMLRMKKLQEEKTKIKDERIQRSFLRLECKKVMVNDAQSNIQCLEDKIATMKRKPSTSLMQNISTANYNMDIAMKHFRITKYKLYHCQ